MTRVFETVGTMDPHVVDFSLPYNEAYCIRPRKSSKGCAVKH